MENDSSTKRHNESAPAADVAVVIATYRRPARLVETLRNVLDQRGVNLEVLVVDDCPDGSAAASMRECSDPRIRYLRNPHPSNGRPAAVRNYGWPLTRAPVIHFMDDDDLVPAGLYADALAAFAASPGVGMIFGRIEPFGEPSQGLIDDRALFVRSARRAAKLQRFGTRRLMTAQILFRELLFIGGSALIQRHCLEAVGGYSTGPEIMEDVDLLARITRLFGVQYIDRPSLYYRVGPSLMHRPGGVQALMDRSYARIHADYRRRFGTVEFFTLKLIARTVLTLY